jgi:hypothetical protein
MKNLHLVVPHQDDPKQEHPHEWNGHVLTSAVTTDKVISQIQHKIDAGITWIYIQRRPYENFEAKIIARCHIDKVDLEHHKVYFRDWESMNARPSDLKIMTGAYLAKE